MAAGCAAAGPRFYAVYVETLTFLFTDIEGSTALLGRLGDDGYAQLLAGHHALVRSALAAHRGLRGPANAPNNRRTEHLAPLFITLGAGQDDLGQQQTCSGRILGRWV